MFFSFPRFKSAIKLVCIKLIISNNPECLFDCNYQGNVICCNLDVFQLFDQIIGIVTQFSKHWSVASQE